MGLAQTLASKYSKQLRVVSLLVDAVSEMRRGEKKLAAILVGVAAITYRSNRFGYLTEIFVRLYQWWR